MPNIWTTARWMPWAWPRPCAPIRQDLDFLPQRQRLAGRLRGSRRGVCHHHHGHSVRQLQCRPAGRRGIPAGESRQAGVCAGQPFYRPGAAPAGRASADLLAEGKEFDEICEEMLRYHKHTHLLFSLESLANLARNGRVKPAVAAVARMLGIRVIGQASEAESWMFSARPVASMVRWNASCWNSRGTATPTAGSISLTAAIPPPPSA